MNTLHNSTPNLPPKRKQPSVNLLGINNDTTEKLINDENNERSQTNLKIDNSEIDPEILGAFEELVKNTQSEVIVDLPRQSQQSALSAPILEEYIDPYAIPIQYLIDQARTDFNPEDMIEESVNDGLDES